MRRSVLPCLLAVCLAVLVVASPHLRGEARAPESPLPPLTRDVRALWVTRTTLTSPDSIGRLIDAAQRGGFNTLLVQVRGRGDAYFDSTIEPRANELAGRPGFDPLAAIVEQAHAAGLRVHAWIAVNLVSSAFTLPASRQHIVYRQPDWLMVPREIAGELLHVDVRSPEYVGRIARWTRTHSKTVEGLFASPLQPAAAEHVAAVVHELAANYAVDGVHLDYVRFPQESFDYSRGALQQFKASVLPDLPAADRQRLEAREMLDPFIFVNTYRERWAAFRRSRLTALVMRLRTAVKSARPSAVVSAAVVPDAQMAFDDRLQDWRTWLDQGLIDVLCPMAYAIDGDEFAKQIAAAQAVAGDRPVWAGIGAYRLATAQTVAHIATARRLGAAGIVLFSYDSLVAPDSATSLTDLARAAFPPGPF